MVVRASVLVVPRTHRRCHRRDVRRRGQFRGRGPGDALGSVAWIDELRSEGKRTAVLYSGEGAERALGIAGIGDRFDSIWAGPRSAEMLEGAFEAIGVTPDRGVVVDVDPNG